MFSEMVKGVDSFSSLFILNPSNRLEKKEEREKRKKREKGDGSGKKEKKSGHLIDRKA